MPVESCDCEAAGADPGFGFRGAKSADAPQASSVYGERSMGRDVLTVGGGDTGAKNIFTLWVSK